jgi:hypothetical protein
MILLLTFAFGVGQLTDLFKSTGNTTGATTDSSIASIVDEIIARYLEPGSDREINIDYGLREATIQVRGAASMRNTNSVSDMPCVSLQRQCV